MSIRLAVERVEEGILNSCNSAGRKRDEVRLMGVSKYQDAAKIAEAWDAGLTLFGESRVQEAVEKYPALRQDRPALELHMIGTLQRNKTKGALSLFDCIESVDRNELIARLGYQSQARPSPVSLLLELNGGEATKSGYQDLDSLARATELVLQYPNLKLRGLMTIAPATPDTQRIRSVFRSLAVAREYLKARFGEADFACLSMGMSGDYQIAIQEGSTLVRIGTAIFGGPA